jgi:hypothetical protein
MIRSAALAACLLCAAPLRAADAPLRVATFDADITCPPGTPLCDGLCPPAKEVVDPLTARGVVILGDGQPIVLCAMDWVGVGNGGYDAFRDALARGAGTTRERVAVHCLHPHDTPGCDFEADQVLTPYGLGGKLFDPAFARQAIRRVAAAVAEAVRHPRTVTHIGIGKARVEEVASTRRVMGPDGKVKYVRYSATRDPKVRDEPEGLIDPYVHLLSFWDDDQPVASLTYYATHPQSYYGQGGVSCDFPGLARGLQDKALPRVLHVHFDGAGGNVTAGKYNDGSHANRMLLARRLAQGMTEAYEHQRKVPVTAAAVEWRVRPVALPLSKLYNVKDLRAQVADEQLPVNRRLQLARALVWARRCEAGEKIGLTCLHIGPAYVLHMPGELFVEYQLAAQRMRPDAPVLMAAYGDYGPGYIGTAVAYTQGGYEVGPVSRVAPAVEDVLIGGMRELLK